MTHNDSTKQLQASLDLATRELNNALRALHVILLTKETREWLAQNDPQALAQAKRAIPVHRLTLDQASRYGEAFAKEGKS